MLRTLLQTLNKLKVAYSNALVVLTQPHVCLLKTVYSMFAFTQLLRTDARILLLTVFVLTKKNTFCRTLAMLTLVRSLADAHITSKLFTWAFKLIRFHNNVYPIDSIHSISSWKFAMPWYRYYIDPHFKQDIKPVSSSLLGHRGWHRAWNRTLHLTNWRRVDHRHELLQLPQMMHRENSKKTKG